MWIQLFCRQQVVTNVPTCHSPSDIIIVIIIPKKQQQQPPTKTNKQKNSTLVQLIYDAFIHL